MVTRLKLKEIDGRAPPGVNTAASSAPDSSLYRGWVGTLAVYSEPNASCLIQTATPSNCGNIRGVVALRSPRKSALAPA
jgi:hypothetical protein